LRILSLDYGDRRIGAAITDELGIAAHGLTTIVRKNREADMETLSSLVKEWEIDTIVIGYPRRIDGSEGIQCEKVNRFAVRLENRFHLPVIRWDETFSTKEAEDILRNDRPKNSKKNKLAVDRVAASIILQSYLDACSRGETRNSQ
jgi:putative Holliday junction resolvase